MIIIGGGGLLRSAYFENALRLVFDTAAPTTKIILWGAGHNDWKLKYWREMKVRMQWESLPFHHIGTRDDNQGQPWVPCVSCMSPLFDKFRGRQAHNDLGLYLHEGTIHDLEMIENGFESLPKITNDASMHDALEFLSGCDTVITNSYHGVYWATLLERKVVALPTSSKFYDLKHPVPLCAPADWRRHRKLSIRYPKALDECRSANVAYADMLKSIL